MKRILFFCFTVALILSACSPENASERSKAYTINSLSGKYRGSIFINREHGSSVYPCELEIMNDGKSSIRVYSSGSVSYEFQGIIDRVSVRERKNAYGEPIGKFEHSFKWKHTGGDPLKHLDAFNWEYRTGTLTAGEKSYGEITYKEYVGKIESLSFSINSLDEISRVRSGKVLKRVD